MTTPNHNTADNSGADERLPKLPRPWYVHEGSDIFSAHQMVNYGRKVAAWALASGDSHYSDESLTNELAAIRDLFPIPSLGSPLEEAWAASMSEPMEVSGFVRKAIAAQTAPADNAVAPTSSAMVQADTDTPEQEIAGLKAVVATLGQALGRLSFAAQTTGGTAGRDEELVSAIKWAERALSLGGIGRAYCEAADAQQSPVQASAPDKAMIDAARRYEIVRKMNVPQFQALYKRNIAGEGRFDDLVDQLASDSGRQG